MSNMASSTILFPEVEQQKTHVCAYLAIGNGFETLIGKSINYILPSDESWEVDLPSEAVEDLLNSVTDHPDCKTLRGRVFLIDDHACLKKCNDVVFPELREAADRFNAETPVDILLLINLTRSEEVLLRLKSPKMCDYLICTCLIFRPRRF